MSISSFSWFKDISIKNKLYFIAGIMFFLIALELVTLYAMVYVLSATRAYVGGESLWSKAEKDATFYLIKYAKSHDENDYNQFWSFIRVNLGDKKAREELIKPHPNREIAAQGFIEGRNLPEDVPGLINLFLWFKNTIYLQRAGAIWTEADVVYIPKLIAIAENLHQHITNKTLTPQDYDKFIAELYPLNAQITQLAENFSYALSDASRWAERVVLRTVLTIALIVEFSGLLLTILITFNIRKGIDEISKVSKKVMRLNFTERAERFSNDEIGQLASSFNQMIDDLESGIYAKNKEIQERKLQERRLSARFAITQVMVQHTSFDQAIPFILQIICETLPFQYGGFWKIDQVDHVMRCSHVWSTDNKAKEFADSCKNITFDIGSILPGKAWESGQAIIIPNLEKDKIFNRAKAALKANLCSAVAIPILNDKKEVRGVLEFFSNTPDVVDESMMQMLNDIASTVSIFIQREQAQNHAAHLSRMTGMAEVASNVLHSVGNTLNSINTSITLMREKNIKSTLGTLDNLDQLFQQHEKDLAHFFETDPKAKSIPRFLSLLAKEWHEENQYFSQELNALAKNILHIKNIIMMQQSISQTVGASEPVNVRELLEEAIMLNKLAYEGTEIDIVREFFPIKTVVTNRDKFLQIILNIVKNAIDALMESSNQDKRLVLRLKEKDDTHFLIQIIDNGKGIPPEYLAKIFTHGFSTKKTGHGFGLHTSALYAEELGGTLVVESKGMGQGAMFTLTLPYQPAAKKKGSL